MFQANDTILYGAEGICRIAGITEKECNGKTMPYYVLRPIHNDTATVFVPLRNDALTKKMRKILTAEQVLALIHTMPEEDAIWIEKDNERKEAYAKTLASGNRVELIRMIKALYLQQQQRKAQGRRLHLVDERFLKDAEKMLYEEFALVLHMECDRVLPFIQEQIHADAQPQ